MSLSSTHKARARFHRQFRILRQENPRLARGLEWISEKRWRPVRVPVALLLLLGSVFAILPVLGLWMLPAGLLLLAIDIPPLQQPVGRLMVWIRVVVRRNGKKRPVRKKGDPRTPDDRQDR